MKKRRITGISFNAPVVLTFCLLCVAAYIAGTLSGGRLTTLLFCVYRAPLTDPLTWVRCLGHVLGHASVDHLVNNLLYILLLGPMLEEKYGSANMALVILITALVTGLVNMLLFPSAALLGASGVVFAMILLSSITRRENGKIPLTFVLVAFLYIGQQVLQGLTANDISESAHITGGVVGSAMGFLLHREK